MKNNEIQNVDNYFKIMVESEVEMYTKYTNIIIQYLLLGIEKIKNHNDEYVKFILIKGVYMITYVFNILLKYTCNLELTYHHCQKSYSYYIEFIGQIGDDAVTYLQLNSKDAALFVYKKTIFEIPEGIKKKYIEVGVNEKKHKNVSCMIDIYNKLIVTEISHLKSEQLKNTEFINRMYTNIGRVNNKLIKLHHSHKVDETNECAVNVKIENESNEEGIKKNESFIKKLNYVNMFCDVMILKKTSSLADTETGGINHYKDYIKTIEYFIKKIRKVNYLHSHFNTSLTSKFFSEQFEEKIKLCNTLKFINWIFLV